jgi:hypothetical protein
LRCFIARREEQAGNQRRQEGAVHVTPHGLELLSYCLVRDLSSTPGLFMRASDNCEFSIVLALSRPNWDSSAGP